jgi:hypothetical protein
MRDRGLADALAGVALRRGSRGFTFDDLARAGIEQGATLGEVAEWLAQARSTGFLAELGFDAGIGGVGAGPRRYRLASARGEGVRAVS